MISNSFKFTGLSALFAFQIGAVWLWGSYCCAAASVASSVVGMYTSSMLADVFHVETGGGELRYFCRNGAAVLKGEEEYRLCGGVGGGGGGGFTMSVKLFPDDGISAPQHWVMADSSGKWLFVQLINSSGGMGGGGGCGLDVKEDESWMSMGGGMAGEGGGKIVSTKVYKQEEIALGVEALPVEVVATLLAYQHFYTSAISLLGGQSTYQKSLYLYMSGAWTESLSVAKQASELEGVENFLSLDLATLLERLVNCIVDSDHSPILNSPHCLHFPLLCDIISTGGGPSLLTPPLNDIGAIDVARSHSSILISEARLSLDSDALICALLNNALNYDLSFNDLVEIQATRKRLGHDLSLLEGKAMSTKNPTCVPVLSLGLCYHGLNDFLLIKRITKTISSILPKIPEIPIQTETPPPPPPSYMKIGVISSHLRHSSVCLALCHTLTRLPSKDIHVTALIPYGSVIDDVSNDIFSKFNNTRYLPNGLHDSISYIKNDSYDVIIYTDVNMSPRTYLYGFYRLAEIQIAFWGHHGMSGLDGIDYYFVGDRMEDDGGKYNEQVVRFGDGLGVYLERDDFFLDDEEAGGLERVGEYVIIPQSIYKFHPEFDSTILRIVEDGKIVVILVDDSRSIHTSKMRERLNAEGVLFVPQLSRSKLIGLEKGALYAHDTSPVGGGITTFELLFNGNCVRYNSNMTVIKTTESAVQVENGDDLFGCRGNWEREDVVEEYREFLRTVGGL
ncbi:hypothetical protein TrST_g3147 [Triparma strigata]|uniref:Uncharacterized protein n=2 Tax=Triparma strigata TaxID=1606541 RepID=A0A9W7C0I6_9STRA|nr:hypothetical protein TrST_g3147 [Triparma strigata]